MNKVLLDTNLYIDWLNTGKHEALMIESGYVRYLSAVVHMELVVGAITRKAALAVGQIKRAYEKSNRLVVPQAASFEQAGELLQKLKKRGREIRSASLVNDVLIAVSARQIGATLYTQNVRDFSVIRPLYDFDFVAV